MNDCILMISTNIHLYLTPCVVLVGIIQNDNSHFATVAFLVMDENKAVVFHYWNEFNTIKRVVAVGIIIIKLFQ